MATSTTGSEPQQMIEAGKGALTVNKACVPCRVRKVKCDAAVVGLPCTSCQSRQCASDCVPLARKGRTRKGVHMSSTPGQTTGNPAISQQRSKEDQLEAHSTSHSPELQDSGHIEPDLLYLRILNDAEKETPGSRHFHATASIRAGPKQEQSLTLRNCQSAKLYQFDETDREYLTKKGVFDLPSPHHLDALVKTYFDHVHPFSAVVSRAEFIRGYQSGDCSLLLLRVMLTAASIHAPVDVLFALGFASRSIAQESFFVKARRLYDFGGDPLVMLQASILMCTVILDHPTDRDFGYWFHNAVSIANRLNLRAIMSEGHTYGSLKLYRRIWWTLCSLDVFHVSLDTRRCRIFESNPSIKSRTEDDWEDEDILGDSSGLLSPITPQQRASPVALCELSQIFGECMSCLKVQPQQDPRQMMLPFDIWRKTLTSKIHIDGDIGTNICYLTIQAMSYRFECILCRLIRHTLHRADLQGWAKQRLRSAVLELDAIATRVLAGGILEAFPAPFVTTFTMLLALHIESALDTTETTLIRSMSQISISQMMLFLKQGREIPVLKRALPIFEKILTKNKLYLVPSNNLDQTPAQPQTRDTDGIADMNVPPHAQFSEVWPHSEQWENNQSLTEFLGFDFSNDWQQFEQ